MKILGLGITAKRAESFTKTIVGGAIMFAAGKGWIAADADGAVIAAGIWTSIETIWGLYANRPSRPA